MSCNTHMTDRSLLIVRGGRNVPDPTFSCIAHSADTGNYVAVEFEDGRVINRTLYRGAERKTLENLARSPTYTSVYADTRMEKHLLPFKYPKNSLNADLNVFRRAKSDEEISSIERMAGILRASRQHARNEHEFRGVVESLDYRHAVIEQAGADVSVKRYGLTDALGRTVELSSVKPHSLDWKARMMRVNHGCQAVEKQLREGVTGEDIDKTFRSHLDPMTDVIYGRVLHHTGYQPWESDIPVDVLQKYDVLTLCPIVGDRRGNSVPYMHSVHTITESRFRGCDASYDTLFDDVSPNALTFRSSKDDEIYERFKRNVDRVMTFWKMSEEVDSADGLLNSLDGTAKEFINDFRIVIRMPKYKHFVQLMTMMLPELMKTEEWSKNLDNAYGTEITEAMLEFFRVMFYWLVLNTIYLETNPVTYTTKQESLIVAGIALVALPIVTQSLLIKFDNVLFKTAIQATTPSNNIPELDEANIPDDKYKWWVWLLNGIWSLTIFPQISKLETVEFPFKLHDDFMRHVREVQQFGPRDWDKHIHGEHEDWDDTQKKHFEYFMEFCLSGIGERIQVPILRESLSRIKDDLAMMLDGRTANGEFWEVGNSDVDKNTPVNPTNETEFVEVLGKGEGHITFDDLVRHVPEALSLRNGNRPLQVTVGTKTYVTKQPPSTRLELYENICDHELTRVGPHPLKIDQDLDVFFNFETTTSDKYAGWESEEHKQMKKQMLQGDDVYKEFIQSIAVKDTQVTVTAHTATQSSLLLVRLKDGLQRTERSSDDSDVLEQFRGTLEGMGWVVLEESTKDSGITQYTCTHAEIDMEIPHSVQTIEFEDATKAVASRDSMAGDINDTTSLPITELLSEKTTVPLTRRLRLDFMSKGEVVAFMECGSRMTLDEDEEIFTIDSVGALSRRIRSTYNLLENIQNDSDEEKSAADLLCTGSMTMFVLRRLVYYLSIADVGVADIAGVVRVLHVRFKAAYAKILTEQSDVALLDGIKSNFTQMTYSEEVPELKARVLRDVAEHRELKNVSEEHRHLARELASVLRAMEKNSVHELTKAMQKTVELTSQLEGLKAQIDEERQRMDEMTVEHERMVAEREHDFEEQLKQIESNHDAEIVEKQAQMQGEFDDVMSEGHQHMQELMQREIDDMSMRHNLEVNSMSQGHQQLLGELTEKHEQEKSGWNTKITALSRDLDAARATIDMEQQKVQSAADEVTRSLENQEIAAELDAAKADNVRLQKIVEQSKGETATLRREVENANRILDDTKARLTAAQTSHLQASATLTRQGAASALASRAPPLPPPQPPQLPQPSQLPQPTDPLYHAVAYTKV